jgi:hypothetical protein
MCLDARYTLEFPYQNKGDVATPIGGGDTFFFQKNVFSLTRDLDEKRCGVESGDSLYASTTSARRSEDVAESLATQWRLAR